MNRKVSSLHRPLPSLISYIIRFGLHFSFCNIGTYHNLPIFSCVDARQKTRSGTSATHGSNGTDSSRI